MDKVTRAIQDTVDAEEAPLTSHRYEKVREDAEKVMASLLSSTTEDLCLRIVEKISECFPPLKGSAASLSERAFTAFVAIRVEVLNPIWAELYSASGMTFHDPLLAQAVNRRIFNRLLVIRADDVGKDTAEDSEVASPLSIDE